MALEGKEHRNALDHLLATTGQSGDLREWHRVDG